MIRKKTVLVLGAGASIPYGFPSGQGLIEHILRLDPFSYMNRGVARDTTALQKLQERLRESGTNSIDLFIERHPSLADIAKIAITVAITKCEQESLRLFSMQEGNWYQYLWSRLTEGAPRREDVFENNLSVITFNYDTSLENFLYSRFLNMYEDTSPQDGLYLLSHIPIMHVFGTTGGHPMQAGRKYGDGPYPTQSKDIFELSKGLLTISEAKDLETKHVEELRKLLLSAEKVVVLGFGYHPENMEIINLASIPARSSFFAAYGEPRSKRLHIERSLQKQNANFDRWPGEGYIIELLRGLDTLNFLIDTSALLE